MITSNTNPRVLQGPLAERPPSPTEDGIIYVSETEISAWNASLGVWVNAGGTTGSWPKYVVSTGDPLAPYNSIQAAINAAIANGHGPSNYAVVLVHPGVYPGNITLKAGVFVVGFSGLIGTWDQVQDGTVQIQGTVAIANEPGNGTYLLQNVGITPAFNTQAVTIDSTTDKQFTFVDVSTHSQNAPSFLIQSATPHCVVSLKGCRLLSEGGFALSALSPVLLTGVDTVISSTSIVGFPTCMFVESPGAGLPWDFVDCEFEGATLLNGGGLLVQNCQASNTNGPLYNAATGTLLRINGLQIKIDAGQPIVEGFGQVDSNNISLLPGTVSNTVVLSSITPQGDPAYAARQFVAVAQSGPGPLDVPVCDEYIIDATGPTIARLPQASTVLVGTRITIKSASAFRVTLIVFPGDSLDRTPDGTYVLVANTSIPRASVELQANATGWSVLNQIRPDVIGPIVSLPDPNDMQIGDRFVAKDVAYTAECIPSPAGGGDQVWMPAGSTTTPALYQPPATAAAPGVVAARFGVLSAGVFTQATVAGQNANAVSYDPAAGGSPVRWFGVGICSVDVDAAYPAGTLLMSDANGKATAWTPGNTPLAMNVATTYSPQTALCLLLFRTL